MSKESKDNHSLRESSYFNFWRKCFAFMVTRFGYLPRLMLVYRLKVYGRENIPSKRFIVCPNHLSTLDPPLMGTVFPPGLAFMTKQELYNNFFMAWWLDWLGTFAVNREKLGVSTVKTIKNLLKTDWTLGIFPQGKREEPGTITQITKGFANIAKLTKSDILPIGITGTDEVHHLPFSGKVVVKIGKPISYEKDADEIVSEWCKSIEDLTGFKYAGNDGVLNETAKL